VCGSALVTVRWSCVIIWKHLSIGLLEYFKYLVSTITKDAGCTREIKSRVFVAKAAFNRKKTPFYQQTGLKFKVETSKMLH
jgi:hypothetical protein